HRARCADIAVLCGRPWPHGRQRPVLRLVRGARAKPGGDARAWPAAMGAERSLGSGLKARTRRRDLPRRASVTAMLPKRCICWSVLAVAVACAGCSPHPPGRARPASAAASGTMVPTPPPSPSPSLSPSPSAPPPLAGEVVGIDPGHNGRNLDDPAFIDRQIWNGRELENCDTTGTETMSGYTEAQFNFHVASYLRADLVADG